MQSLGAQVKRANFLIKNLTEMDSLPHLRNLIEIPLLILLIDRVEGKGEVDDEREKVGGEGDVGALPEGDEEGERWDAGRVDRAHRL
jgi:hypothetical protein